MTKKLPLGGKEVLSVAGAASLIYTAIKSVTDKPSLAVIVALSMFVMILLCWSIYRIFNDDENRFKLVSMRKGDEAKGANKRIKQTQSAIRVTHFTEARPNERYISLMLKKLDSGVRIYRLVAEDSANGNIEWLKPFRQKKCYKEYKIRGKPIPVDFCVFDDQVVILYLPDDTHGGEFNKAIIFNNHKVALIFRDLFERLVLLSDVSYDDRQAKLETLNQ